MDPDEEIDNVTLYMGRRPDQTEVQPLLGPGLLLEVLGEQHAYARYTNDVSREQNLSFNLGVSFRGVQLQNAMHQGRIERQPQSQEVQQVYIKRIDRDALDVAIRDGYAERPVVEVSRMQTIGDNEHVIRILDAILTGHFLYIIMPFCEGKSLAEYCPLSFFPDARSEATARNCFRAMLNNLIYLLDHRICHRDIDPSNILLNNGGALFGDSAMSIKIRAESDIVRPRGRCGKRSYWPPEIFNGEPFNAFQVDLWACVCTLFTLLVGEPLYSSPADVGFVFGCSDGFLTLENWKIPENWRLRDAQALNRFSTEVLPKIQALSPEVRSLFHNSLQYIQQNRWTLIQVLECDWVRIQS